MGCVKIVRKILDYIRAKKFVLGCRTKPKLAESYKKDCDECNSSIKDTVVITPECNLSISLVVEDTVNPYNFIISLIVEDDSVCNFTIPSITVEDNSICNFAISILEQDNCSNKGISISYSPHIIETDL